MAIGAFTECGPSQPTKTIALTTIDARYRMAHITGSMQRTGASRGRRLPPIDSGTRTLRAADMGDLRARIARRCSQDAAHTAPPRRARYRCRSRCCGTKACRRTSASPPAAGPRATGTLESASSHSRAFSEYRHLRTRKPFHARCCHDLDWGVKSEMLGRSCGRTAWCSSCDSAVPLLRGLQCTFGARKADLRWQPLFADSIRPSLVSLEPGGGSHVQDVR